MEELLVLVLEVLVEALIYFPWDIFLYTREVSKQGSPGVLGWSFGSLFVGSLVGGITLLLVPHVLLTSSSLRILSLFLSPILSGAVAARLASKRAKSKGIVEVRTHFWGAFMFTMGIVVVRFTFATR